jgi:hypothetical protein
VGAAIAVDNILASSQPRFDSYLPLPSGKKMAMPVRLVLLWLSKDFANNVR